MNKRKFQLRLILCIAFLAFLTHCKEGDHSSGAETLLNHFAGSCRSSAGSWSSSAIQQTQSLMATLQTIRDQEANNCAGLSSALQATQDIHLRLAKMVQDPTINSYRVAEEKKLELILALGRLNSSTSPDPNIVNALREELYATELQLVNTRAEASVSKSEQEQMRLINGLTDLNQYVFSLISQGNLSACLASSPQMPLGIAASLLAIGGNFATPLMGARLAAVGGLMATTVNYLRQQPIDKMELDLQNTQMQSALTCSLETMSDLYCDAETTFKYIDFALTGATRLPENNSVWKGLDLVGRRMPVLNRWLLKVSSGVDPSDPYSAARIASSWSRFSKTRQTSTFVNGEINRTKRLLQEVNSPSERVFREKEGFKNVIAQMFGFEGNPSSQTIIADFISETQAICDLSGATPCSRQNGESRGDMIDRLGIVDGFASFEGRARNLLDNVYQLVTKELLGSVSQDPDGLVAEATQANLNNWSPLKVLREISEFARTFANELRKLSDSDIPGRDRTIAVAEDTANVLTEVADQITGQAPTIEVIRIAFDKLKLLDGNQFLTQRISQIVRWDLEIRIRKGELPGDISTDLAAAGSSLSDQLERSGIFVEQDADALVNDIRNAQFISRENLKHTTDFFSGTIGKLLLEIKKSAQEAGESDPMDPANRRLAHLCLLILTTTPHWPQNVDMRLCRGTRLISIHRDRGLELNFDQLARTIYGPKPMPYHNKVCTYSNFLRAARIFRAPRSGELIDANSIGIPGVRFIESSQATPISEIKRIPMSPRDYMNWLIPNWTELTSDSD